MGGVGGVVQTDYLVEPRLSWTGLGCDNKYKIHFLVAVEIFKVCFGLSLCTHKICSTKQISKPMQDTYLAKIYNERQNQARYFYTSVTPLSS